MPTFGKKSQDKLETCHPNLITLMWSVVKQFDITIVWGYRDKGTQDAMYAAKPRVTNKKFPDSRHNVLPCMAVDIAPWPEVYGRNDEEKKCAAINFAFMAGHVMAHAAALGLTVRWGGDWNRNLSVTDEDFKDMGHFELL